MVCLFLGPRVHTCPDLGILNVTSACEFGCLLSLFLLPPSPPPRLPGCPLSEDQGGHPQWNKALVAAPEPSLSLSFPLLPPLPHPGAQESRLREYALCLGIVGLWYHGVQTQHQLMRGINTLKASPLLLLSDLLLELLREVFLVFPEAFLGLECARQRPDNTQANPRLRPTKPYV